MTFFFFFFEAHCCFNTLCASNPTGFCLGFILFFSPPPHVGYIGKRGEKRELSCFARKKKKGRKAALLNVIHWKSILGNSLNRSCWNWIKTQVSSLAFQAHALCAGGGQKVIEGCGSGGKEEEWQSVSGTGASRAPHGKLACFAFGLCAATMEIVSLVLKGFSSHVVKPLWRATKGQTSAAVLFFVFFLLSCWRRSHSFSFESRTSLLGDASPPEVAGALTALWNIVFGHSSAVFFSERWKKTD